MSVLVALCSTLFLNMNVFRASMEGPLWCLVLQQFFTGLENSLGDANRSTVLLDFIRYV